MQSASREKPSVERNERERLFSRYKKHNLSHDIIIFQC